MGKCLHTNAVAPAVGNSWHTLYTAPAGEESLIKEIHGSVVAAADLLASVRIYDLSEQKYCYLIKNAPIPSGDSIRIVDKAKIVLEAGDSIEVLSGSPGETVDFFASIMNDITDPTLGYFKNAILPAVGNSWTTLYEAPAGKSSILIQVNTANIAETGVQISARYYHSASNAYVSLNRNGPVPIADALRLIDDSKIVLLPGDRIEVVCETPGQTVDCVGSLIEDVNQV